MTLPQMLLWGAVGGVLPDAIRLVRQRHNEALPPYLRSFNFYVGLALAVALGAAAAALIGAGSVKEALAYGFGAPELLTRLLSSPRTEPGTGRINAVRTLGEWWAV
jgi:hypothetical protein